MVRIVAVRVKTAVLEDVNLLVVEIAQLPAILNVLAVVSLNVVIIVQEIVLILVLLIVLLHVILIVKINAMEVALVLYIQLQLKGGKMKNYFKQIKLNEDVVDYVQAAFEDYKAKQDLITMIFELHKYDEDYSIIESEPFKYYEKCFMKAKVKYDTIMKEIQEKNTFNNRKSIVC